ncbi:MAG: hypothetical protein K9N10_16390 [Deltaproteobacteria bacterium]|nr:hypothetical protein [Deltaproteobacteria bacterium]
MTLPAAHIGHRTSDRVRIRIPSRKGDEAYFSKIKKSLLEDGTVEGLEVNPRTGSILIKGSPADLENILSVGEKNALFKLKDPASKVVPLSRKIAVPFRDLGRAIDRFSGGEIDLAGAVFLGLIGWGMVQLARGNFVAPPWYVAFWYALGIFTKSLADKSE